MINDAFATTQANRISSESSTIHPLRVWQERYW
jgi:hypothetical protein